MKGFVIVSGSIGLLGRRVSKQPAEARETVAGSGLDIRHGGTPQDGGLRRGGPDRRPWAP